MSGRRPAADPPVLAGYTYLEPLGTGGFADVFLYQREYPRNKVAVKVMLRDRLDDESKRRFVDEANLMAELGSHPSIVQIFDSSVSDDGRPYLIMEYCPGPNLQIQHSRQPFSEAKTLDYGVQIAGAVEMAHRAGILHRDIKPANILGGAYNRPKLSDFGIAGSSSSASAGLSVPWSPPESFGGTASPASDVYSLAATLYTLVANRSPFQISGASNGDLDMMRRIETMPLPPIGRPDVSDAFEAVMARAMAKNPRDRYASALEFARALQHVQILLKLGVTQLTVEEEEIAPVVPDEDGPGTRHREVKQIDAQAPTAPPSFSAPTISRVGGSPVVADTIDASRMPSTAGAGRPVFVPSSEPTETSLGPVPTPTLVSERVGDVASAPVPARRKPRWGLLAATGVIVAVAAAVAVAAVVIPRDEVESPRPAISIDPVDAAPTPASSTPLVSDLTGVVTDGTAVFSWTNPAPASGDLYLWRPVVPGEEHDFEETAETRVTVPATGSAAPCIEVVLRRADGRSSADGAERCAT